MKIIKFCLLLFCLTYLVSCGQVSTGNSSIGNNTKSFNVTNGNLAETPTPKIIKELDRQLEKYTPKVKIVSPQKEQIFDRATISIQLEVEDLTLFNDDKLKLGNHLNLILDNEPSKLIYDLTQPVVLENLTPGTHTIRVFACRPWGESFKNDGAYDLRTFSILTETNDNRPDRNLPLLTYNSPTGTYSAEPFLLDFYLTNAPLHSVAQSDPNLEDWKIKATVNGDSFFIENWQPFYLKGLNEGANWIQLELINEEGNNIENAFNNTVRVINYDPRQTDTLGKLVTDKISLTEAQSIVEQNYYIQPVGMPEIIEPTVEIEEPKSIESDAVEKTIEPIEEASIEDKTEIEMTKVESKKTMSEPGSAKANSVFEEEQQKNSNLTENKNTEEVSSNELLKQTVTIPAPATEEAEEVTKTDRDKLAEKMAAVESKEIITINQKNSDSAKPLATIEITQSESVENSGDKIAITVPQIDSNSVPEMENATPTWWKNILVSLRQKLESLVELLPNKV
ncbi:hypothetical protein I4641_22205 [Waterburya agarophytonicola K14]|uniref:FHA domain containing protein n=1 Tax=Waterburya agarophytonicola KI4 TaxID=2874699 RepID=A0A964FM03_9CYAN|nr:hypothetical protein [Waterburya agarophytonicola]MCC0179668.1 hypothetical protein [Waterburya agarophytonicola KI4]